MKVLVRSDSIREGVGYEYVVSDCAVPIWWTNRVEQKGVLIGWAGGRAADALSNISLESIKCRAAQSIGAIFSRMQPVASEDIHVVDWSKQAFSLGAYSYTPDGCDGDALRSALAAPERDTLFFAGEATDPVYFATVTGALRSGRCAARSVLAILYLRPRLQAVAGEPPSGEEHALPLQESLKRLPARPQRQKAEILPADVEDVEHHLDRGRGHEVERRYECHVGVAEAAQANPSACRTMASPR